MRSSDFLPMRPLLDDFASHYAGRVADWLLPELDKLYTEACGVFPALDGTGPEWSGRAWHPAKRRTVYLLHLWRLPRPVLDEGAIWETDLAAAARRCPLHRLSPRTILIASFVRRQPAPSLRDE